MQLVHYQEIMFIFDSLSAHLQKSKKPQIDIKLFFINCGKSVNQN